MEARPKEPLIQIESMIVTGSPRDLSCDTAGYRIAIECIDGAESRFAAQ
jgi:hypothetical protein